MSNATTLTVCAICRNNLTDLCIVCQAEDISDKSLCTNAVGVCGHEFHRHCIVRWLNMRECCPLDSKPWEEGDAVALDLFEEGKQQQ